MIISGNTVIYKNIVKNILNKELQTQPCGIDFTLKKIYKWKSSGIIDYDNKLRKIADKEEILFNDDIVDIQVGTYLVEFNETVEIPFDIMGQLFIRSTLFRSGAILSAGVMDSGYNGSVGCLLQVVNPYGIKIYKNAKIGQFVFHQMNEKVKNPYNGKYQNSKTI